MKNTKYNQLESEEEEFLDDLSSPFNPKDIDITVETRSLDSIISRILHGEIDMNTHFQRKGDLWANTIMSRLIESILIRFPLPAFYFDATDDDKWLIVDGLQRLSAVKKFVLNTDPEFVRRNYSDEDRKAGKHKPLRLTGLEYLKEHDGKTYDELPSNLRRRISDAQITTYLVKPGTPEEVVYSVFYRINTGGLMLNPQEIRHALNQNGNAPTYLEQFTDLPIFRDRVKISDKRMQDRELALRYVGFRLYHYQNYKPPLVRFLNKVMKDLAKLPKGEFTLLKDEFKNALECSFDIFGDDAFSKSIINEDYKTSLNRALFEAWTVILSELSAEQHDVLRSSKKILRKKFVELLQDVEFDKSISASTTGSMQVTLRFTKIRELVNDLLL
jgi:hypothetical protein